MRTEPLGMGLVPSYEVTEEPSLLGPVKQYWKDQGVLYVHLWKTGPQWLPTCWNLCLRLPSLCTVRNEFSWTTDCLPYAITVTQADSLN